MVLGLAIIVVGLVLVAVGGAGGGASVGGVVFIGPIPIAFGSGPSGGQLILLSLALGAAMIAGLVAWAWSISRSKRR